MIQSVRFVGHSTAKAFQFHTGENAGRLQRIRRVRFWVVAQEYGPRTVADHSTDELAVE
jgi:hypothetical protein